MKPKLIDTSVLSENYIDTNFPKLKNWRNLSVENWLKGLNQTITHKGKTLIFGKDYTTEYIDGKLIIKLLENE